ncbi:MAG TPA: T9SS type A sorting domain-containing protein, partial [Bacteroidetes bacterium]|nr:T9SS type A sorting domain-containing protein [Bacteroidota bacterium]
LYRAVTDRQFKLDKKGLNPGVYFVELNTEQGVLIEKLIIN